MKKIILIIACAFCSINSFGQQREFKEGCDFLKNLQYKNGSDTVTVLGKLTGLSKVNIYGDLMKLAKKTNTDIKDYNTGIVIQPVNCGKEYLVAAYLKSLGKNGISLMKPDENIILKFRCIIFEGYFSGTQPLFIVDKVSKP